MRFRRFPTDGPLPETIGIEERPFRPGVVDVIWDRARDLWRTGLYPAVTLCVRHGGMKVIDRAVGWSRGPRAGGPESEASVAVTPSTPICVFSISKAITAMLIHILDDQGLLHIDDAVAEYLPAFAAHGKSEVTIRHVLTHRAGIPSIAGDAGAELLLDEDRIVRLLCDAEPVHGPGRGLAYHAVTGGFILGAVVRKVTGEDPRAVLRRLLLDPCGIRTLDYGWPGDHTLIARNAYTGPPVPFPLSRLVDRALGVGMEKAVEISNGPEWAKALVPSGNCVGTADDLSRFFEMLLRGGHSEGRFVLDRRTVRRATSETAFRQLDLTLGLPVRYGIGLMLGSEHVSVFGPGTPRAFGHLGFINCFGWADPDRDLSVALLTTGKPFLGAHIGPLVRLIGAISSGFPRRA